MFVLIHFKSISIPYRIDFKSIPNRFQIHSESISNPFRIDFKSIPNRFQIQIKSISNVCLYSFQSLYLSGLFLHYAFLSMPIRVTPFLRLLKHRLLKHRLLKHRLQKHQLFALNHRLSTTSTVYNIDWPKHQLSKKLTV